MGGGAPLDVGEDGEPRAKGEPELPYKKEGIIGVMKARGGWLTIFFVGLVLAALVVEQFEHLLQANVELSYFVPLLAIVVVLGVSKVLIQWRPSGLTFVWRRLLWFKVLAAHASFFTRVKLLVGFYQIVGALPTVYGVRVPEELEVYVGWLSWLVREQHSNSGVRVSLHRCATARAGKDQSRSLSSGWMRPTIDALPAVGDRRGSPGADRHICRSLRSRSRHHKAPAWRESIQGQELKTAAFKTRTRVHPRETLDDDNHE